MPNVVTHLKGIFRRQCKETTASDLLKVQYYNFKSLLSLNERALLDMSDLEQKLRQNQAFGMPFVRSRVTSLSVQVYHIIETLNRVSDGRHSDLFVIFDRLKRDINFALEDRTQRPEGPLIVPLENLSKKDADLVGPKMAVMGEIKNSLYPLVPEGFAITSGAARMFMGRAGLTTKINSLFQSCDTEDVSDLQESCERIRALICEAPFPPELEAAIRGACARLARNHPGDLRLAVRSSALGEDTLEHSFAGLYDTELGVFPPDILDAYKRVLASKYSARAITYRENHGLRDEGILMGVGCMVMVPAAAGGVVTSRDPRSIKAERIVIDAAAGLGTAVVEGSVFPEHLLLEKTAGNQWCIRQRQRSPDSTVAGSLLTEDVISKLADLARRFEDHFKSPQDIEWAIDPAGGLFILQSRPLHASTDHAEPETDRERRLPGVPPLLRQGLTACSGTAWGVARIVKEQGDMQNFFKGDVLVVEHALPRWAVLLKKASAIVADTGGVVGHLATVAREFAVPAIVNTRIATRVIKDGGIITVDADDHTVYPGKIDILLEKRKDTGSRPFCGTPVYSILKRIMEKISPLNLLDPNDAGFRGANCQTYHDIIRFSHETAIAELFAFNSRHSTPRHAGKQLMTDNMPVRLWVMGLDDSLLRSAAGKCVRLDEIDSRPFLAFWEGVVAVPWQGPPAPDAKGFMTIMAESTMNPDLEASAPSRMVGGNRALVTQNFCNVSLRWGYHLSATQAFWGVSSRENHLRFSFQGGAADLTRRDLRVRLIATVLERYGFQVRAVEDHITAQLDGYEGDEFGKRIKLLGYINIHACQIDMIMGNANRTRQYREKMLQDIEKKIFGH
ncbi:MAG: PEP/pyruvate-binding domain-containing protein [Desulfobacterales bacterium]